MSQQFQDYLNSLKARGQADSEGTFRLDPRKLQSKYQASSLEPGHYLLCLIAGLTLHGAESIKIYFQGPKVVLTYPDPLPSEQLASIWAGLMVSDQDVRWRSFHLLAVGMSGALGDGAHKVECQGYTISANGVKEGPSQGNRMTLDFGWKAFLVSAGWWKRRKAYKKLLEERVDRPRVFFSKHQVHYAAETTPLLDVAYQGREFPEYDGPPARVSVRILGAFQRSRHKALLVVGGVIMGELDDLYLEIPRHVAEFRVRCDGLPLDASKTRAVPGERHGNEFAELLARAWRRACEEVSLPDPRDPDIEARWVYYLDDLMRLEGPAQSSLGPLAQLPVIETAEGVLSLEQAKEQGLVALRPRSLLPLDFGPQKHLLERAGVAVEVLKPQEYGLSPRLQKIGLRCDFLQCKELDEERVEIPVLEPGEGYDRVVFDYGRGLVTLSGESREFRLEPVRLGLDSSSYQGDLKDWDEFYLLLSSDDEFVVFKDSEKDRHGPHPPGYEPRRGVGPAMEKHYRRWKARLDSSTPS